MINVRYYCCFDDYTPRITDPRVVFKVANSITLIRNRQKGTSLHILQLKSSLNQFNRNNNQEITQIM